MRKVAVKIRGIYTTALTKFLLDNGYAIVQPSLQIQERFLLPENKMPEDILIRDREDHQGLFICGNIEQVAQLILLFRAHFFDMVIRRKFLNGIEGFIEEDLLNTYIRNNEQKEISLEVEFPGAAKAALDCLRAGITPTIRNHHLLKIIASDLVKLVEEKVSRYPFRQKELEEELQEQVIYGPMKKKGFIELTHVRPEGKVLSLRGGKILSLENKDLFVKREFSGGLGQYDGLDLPIVRGDYSITQIIENHWSLKHTYYSSQGLIKGTYWNINTPIEFYPDHIRYLDLHIDVIQRPGACPKIIDQEKLEKALSGGFISKKLFQKCFEISQSLIR